MGNFFIDLEERLVKAIEIDFTNIKKMIGNEKIYALSLVTDSDAVSLFLALNTIEFLEKKMMWKIVRMTNYLLNLQSFFLRRLMS
ncbi:DUF4303 domain-containing protein [Ferdinandcohnia quinoae]|uniref:DUF4303 domain-containing protein n=1 Tax=Fredinandcohnia quinoae TaxID=2918902 RepID=UPI003D66BC5C